MFTFFFVTTNFGRHAVFFDPQGTFPTDSISSSDSDEDFRSVEGEISDTTQVTDMALPTAAVSGPTGPFGNNGADPWAAAARAAPGVLPAATGRERGSGGAQGRSRSREEDESRPPAWWATARAALNEDFRSELNPLQQTLDQHTADIAAIQTSVNAHTSDIAAMRGQIAALQTRSSDASSNASTRAPFVTRGDWNPEYIELKGWITDWKNYEQRGRQMLEQSVVDNILNEIVRSTAVAGTEVESKIDIPRSRQENSGRTFGYSRIRIFFMTGTSGKSMWECRHRIVELLGNRGLATLVPIQDKPQVTIRVIVEIAPHKLPHVNATGKFQNILRREMRTANIMGDVVVRAELGPPVTHFWAKLPNEMGNGNVVAVYGQTGYEILPALQQLLPQINPDTVLTALRAE